MTAPEVVEEVNRKKNTRDDISLLYAAAIKEHEAGDGFAWSIVNEAIISRWSKSALAYIKKAAWELVMLWKVHQSSDTGASNNG